MIRFNVPFALLAIGTVFIFGSCKKASEHVKRKAAPPLEGVNKPFHQYSFASEKSQTTDLPTGTRIKIPSDAFVKENGEPYNGEVTFNHDATDIIAAGIHMRYDSAGTTHAFETAGMFEMNAKSAKGNPLKLASNKQINVQMASYTKGDNFSFYRFQEEKQSSTGKTEQRSGRPGKLRLYQ